MKMITMIRLTFRESFAKKTFMAFFGISTLVCLLFMFALNLDIVDGMQSAVSVFGQQVTNDVDVEAFVIRTEGFLASFLFGAGIFLSLFATSSLIPDLLRTGFIDLLISKPLSRMQILSGRYLGAVAIVAFNIFYMVIFFGLIISLKTGVWNWAFLWSAFIIVITFAVLYALMMLLGLLTKSGAFSLMITYLILFFSPLLLQRDQIYALLSSKFYGYLLDGLYYFLPKTGEIGAMTNNIVAGIPVSSWMPLWSSALFAFFIFSVSVYIFQKKNF